MNGFNLSSGEQSDEVKKITDNIVAQLRKLNELVPNDDDAEAQERIRELEFQNSTLALRVQQLEATISAMETKQPVHTPEHRKPGSFMIHTEDKRSVLARTSSAVFRIRSESSNDLMGNEHSIQAGAIPPELKDQLSPKLTTRKRSNTEGDDELVDTRSKNSARRANGIAKASRERSRSGDDNKGKSKVNNAPYRLLMCSDENCEVMDPTNNVIKMEHMTRTLIRLMWRTEPRRVLLIKKPNDKETTDALALVTKFLYNNFEVTTMVEDYVKDELEPEVAAMVYPCNRDKMQHEKPDFIVCLGGDGTILWASSIFTNGMPPLVSFSMGSLGFLTPFPFTDMESTMCKVMAGGFLLTLRSRLVCEIIRGDGTSTGEKFTVLNEVVVDRGENSNLVHVHLFVSNRKTPITDVQGDGIIVSTPTGSTAYSLAAGGCMVHPAIPAMVVTPICPHSLSFRPFVVADATFLKLQVPLISRSSAWISFDGRNRQELERGDSLVCRVSQYPVPAICKQGESDDWFTAIKDSFLWNERTVQKST